MGDMGPGTWSGTLAACARAGTELTVCVDGPFGSLSIQPTAFKSLVLIAGGVGITPMASILGHLVALRNASTLDADVQVTLIWTIRESEMLGWFQPLLDQASSIFNIHIYISRGEISLPHAASDMTISSGRPNLSEEFETVASQA